MKKQLICLLATAAALLCAAGEPLAPEIDVASTANWSKTRGATFKVEDGAVVIDGSDWDSKILRNVILTPETFYTLRGSGRGKTMVRLQTGWGTGDTVAGLNLSGDAWRDEEIRFRTPAGNGRFSLSIQVNAEKGRAEVRSLELSPVIGDQAKLSVTFSQQNISLWQKTRGVTFTVENDAAVLDGRDWDSKIYRSITLLPDTLYRASGVGRGQVIARVYSDNKPICQLNLSGKEWFDNNVKFRTPAGQEKFSLVIQVNAPKGRGEVRMLEFMPLAGDPDKVELDPARLRANRPEPEIVRGFMVGGFDTAAAEAIRKWGGNVIRLQISPIGFARGRGTDWESAWPAYLDDIEKKVGIARDHGLKVVIDLHGAPMPGVRGDYTEMWVHPDLEKNFLKVWRDLATRLKPYSDTIWGYDLYNEPLDRNQLPAAPKEWRPLALKLLKAIREIDPEVWIIFEPGPGGGSGGLRGMYPLPDYRVIYSTHFYTPHEFTHQGILNIAGTDLARALEKINVKYPGEINGRMYDKAALERSLKEVDDFLAKYPVPYYIGEFSVVRWAPEGSGEQYLKDVIELFEERNWSWSYHAFREFHGWSLEHDGQYWMPGMPEPKRVGDSPRGAVVREFLKRNPQPEN